MEMHEVYSEEHASQILVQSKGSDMGMFRWENAKLERNIEYMDHTYPLKIFQAGVTSDMSFQEHDRNII